MDTPEKIYIQKAVLVDLAETVRRYVAPTRNDKFCSRSELLGKLAELNDLINGKEKTTRPDAPGAI